MFMFLRKPSGVAKEGLYLQFTELDKFSRCELQPLKLKKQFLIENFNLLFRKLDIFLK